MMRMKRYSTACGMNAASRSMQRDERAETKPHAQIRSATRARSQSRSRADDPELQKPRQHDDLRSHHRQSTPSCEIVPDAARGGAQPGRPARPASAISSARTGKRVDFAIERVRPAEIESAGKNHGTPFRDEAADRFSARSHFRKTAKRCRRRQNETRSRPERLLWYIAASATSSSSLAAGGVVRKRRDADACGDRHVRRRNRMSRTASQKRCARSIGADLVHVAHDRAKLVAAVARGHVESGNGVFAQQRAMRCSTMSPAACPSVSFTRLK